MSMLVKLLIAYLVIDTIFIILDWFVGVLKKVKGRCRHTIGFPIFLLAVYLFPMLVFGEMIIPGLLSDLRPLIFGPGRLTVPGDRRTDG